MNNLNDSDDEEEQDESFEIKNEGINHYKFLSVNSSMKEMRGPLTDLEKTQS